MHIGKRDGQIGFIAIAALLACIIACADASRSAPDGRANISEELRLDAKTEDFSAMGRVVVNSRGDIIVGQPQDVNVRIYDSTGKRVATFGRKGEAPGEFDYIGQIALKGDTIWVQDQDFRKFTYFTPKGDLIRVGGLPGDLSQTTAYNGSSEFMFVFAIGMHPDGSMLATGRRRAPSVTRGSRSELLHISTDGGIHPVATTPDPEDPRWMMEVAGLGRQIPFTGWPLTAIASDGSRIAHAVTELTSNDGGTYTLTVLRANGDTIFAKTFPYTGVPIPQSAKDSAANAEISTEGPSEGPSDLDERFKRLALQKMPNVYAPLQSLLIGMDETIWLTLRDSAGVRPTIVFDAAGNEIGRVELTTRQRIRQATSRRIWVTELDDTDLASIVRYRVAGLRAR
jgi:hypothetical protein